MQGDVQQYESLPIGEKFTHVLHAATDSTLGPTLNPLQRYDQIVDGTRNILKLAVQTGAHRFLLTSSGAIYGPQPFDLPGIPEDWISAPNLNLTRTAYGQGKRAAEHLCAIYREMFDLEVIVARCFAFVGPDLPLNSHFAIENFVSNALYSDQIYVKGDGSAVRSYLDQRELAHWLWVLLFEGLSGEAYNVGSNKSICVSQLAQLVRDLISPHKPVCISSEIKESSCRNRYVPDITKVEYHHGLCPSLTLQESIQYMANKIKNK